MGMSGEIKQTTHTYQWWRWPFVPVASILGAYLCASIFTIFEWILLKFNLMLDVSDWFFQYILPIISASVFGYFYIMVACYIAPNRKIATAILMTTALMLLSAFGLYIIWLKATAYILTSKITLSLQCLANCVACIFATLIVKEDQEKKKELLTNSTLPIIRVKEL